MLGSAQLTQFKESCLHASAIQRIIVCVLYTYEYICLVSIAISGRYGWTLSYNYDDDFFGFVGMEMDRPTYRSFIHIKRVAKSTKIGIDRGIFGSADIERVHRH